MLVSQKHQRSNNWTIRWASFSICTALLVTGCSEPTETATKPKPKSIIGQKTQDIGEAEEGVEEAEMTAKPGLLTSMSAYGPAVGKIAKMQVQQAINLFNAEHDRYPKDHAEFMAEIVKKNNLQLPVLPGKRRYQYDVKNHQLIIVEKAEDVQQAED
jgi:hypothetical protein